MWMCRWLASPILPADPRNGGEAMDFRLTWAKQPSLWRQWEAQAKRGSCPSYATMHRLPTLSSLGYKGKATIGQ